MGLLQSAAEPGFKPPLFCLGQLSLLNCIASLPHSLRDVRILTADNSRALVLQRRVGEWFFLSETYYFKVKQMKFKLQKLKKHHSGFPGEISCPQLPVPCLVFHLALNLEKGKELDRGTASWVHAPSGDFFPFLEQRLFVWGLTPVQIKLSISTSRLLHQLSPYHLPPPPLSTFQLGQVPSTLSPLNPLQFLPRGHMALLCRCHFTFFLQPGRPDSFL